jgi:hypothetical protein
VSGRVLETMTVNGTILSLLRFRINPGEDKIVLDLFTRWCSFEYHSSGPTEVLEVPLRKKVTRV